MRFRIVVTAAFVGYMIVMMSTMVGLSHGLDATSAADAQIEKGVDYNLSNEQHDNEQLNVTVDPFPLVPDKWLVGPLKPKKPSDIERNSFARRFADKVVRHSMNYASGVSVFTYHNQSWIKIWWVRPLFKLLSYGGIIAFSGYFILTYANQIRAA